MGNTPACSVSIAKPQICSTHLANGPTQIQSGIGTDSSKDAAMVAMEYLDTCSPCTANRALDPLNDKECADIALVQATLRGDLSDVQRAIAQGASLHTTADIKLRMGAPSKKGRNSKAKHVTPLMRASSLGHEDVVECLLKAKASPSECDSCGWTPLCYALGAGEVDIARVLWEHSGPHLKRHRETIRRLQAELLAKCVAEAGQDAAAQVRYILGPEGFLSSNSHQGKTFGSLDVETRKRKGNSACEVPQAEPFLYSSSDAAQSSSTSSALMLTEEVDCSHEDATVGHGAMDFCEYEKCQVEELLLCYDQDPCAKVDELLAGYDKELDLLLDGKDAAVTASTNSDGTAATSLTSAMT